MTGCNASRGGPGAARRVVPARGSELHDQLAGDGWQCVVTPPHLVVQEKCNAQKNDRNDSRRLAKNNEIGDYRECHVPWRGRVSWWALWILLIWRTSQMTSRKSREMGLTVAVPRCQALAMCVSVARGRLLAGKSC